jgi:hypothetical protein
MGVAIASTLTCIVGCVGLHLFALSMLWHCRPQSPNLLRGSHIAVLVLGCIVAHILEIAVFTLGLFVVAAWDGDTRIALEAYKELDLWFYSASFYTSLGSSSTPPSAGLRLFAASEALTGLILITWTASFLFLLMQQAWIPKDESTPV